MNWILKLNQLDLLRFEKFSSWTLKHLDLLTFISWYMDFLRLYTLSPYCLILLLYLIPAL